MNVTHNSFVNEFQSNRFERSSVTPTAISDASVTSTQATFISINKTTIRNQSQQPCTIATFRASEQLDWRQMEL